MLVRRVATSLVGVPVILGLILLGGVPYSFAIAVVLCFALLEFYTATGPAGPSLTPTCARPPFLISSVGLIVAAAHNGVDWWTASIVLVLVSSFLLVLPGQAETALARWLWLAGGALYVGFLGSHLVLLRQLPNGRDWVILAVFSTFATDTAAYFTGRFLGRTLLAPHVSPGKTLEGSLGGLLAGLAAVLVLNRALDAGAGAEIIPLAFLLPLAAQLGDLAESLLKRSAGVKDAGALLPGHGGLLDRLDSILFVSPLVYYYLLWVVL